MNLETHILDLKLPEKTDRQSSNVTEEREKCRADDRIYNEMFQFKVIRSCVNLDVNVQN